MNTPIPQITKGTKEYFRMIGRRGGSKRSPHKVQMIGKNLERARAVGAVKRQFKTVEGTGKIMNSLTLEQKQQFQELYRAANWATLGVRRQLDQMCSLYLRIKGLKK